MKKQQLLANPLKHKNKGQSLVELTLILMILLTLLVGMVEFGNLLNQYINIVDGAREGARFSGGDDPFVVTVDPETGELKDNYEPFFIKAYHTVRGFFNETGGSKGAIDPLVLTKDNGDDILVTFFSVESLKATSDVKLTVFICCTKTETVAAKPKYGEFQNQESRFSADDFEQIKTMLNGDAPSAGVLLVEVFYNYHQLLRLGSFLQDENGNGILDPIMVHAYSVMPLSAAEPTATTPH
jgi:hypothetical protein